MFSQKAAVVGTGFIGPVHVEALQRAGVEVIGILGSTPQKSHQASERLGLSKGYDSLDAVLSDSDVDVVHITSPNRFHFDQTSRALEAGKHVLCEKPLAMNAKESGELVRLAARSQVAAGVNYNIRYYPLCVEAAERVRGGDLGDLFHVTGGYVQDWLFYSSDFNWRVLADEGGELRAVADIGTHWLDLLQHVMDDKVEAVCADLATIFPRRTRPVGGVETFSGKRDKPTETESVDVTTEDYGSILLRMASGARGAMWVSQVTAGRKNCLRFEIAGSKQSLSWNSESPNELEIGYRDRANERLIRDPALMHPQASAATSYPGGHNEGFGDTFKQLFLDFYRGIESGDFRDRPTYPTFEDGHREVLVCQAILNSHHQQGWMQVGEQPS